MNNKKILFLLYHGTGHFNASFALIRWLLKTNHVTLAGVPFFKTYAESQGFTYHSLNTVPFGLGLEKWVNEQQKRKPIYFNTFQDRWNNKIFHERTEELKNLVQQLNPDFIFLDAQQNTDFVILQPLLKPKTQLFLLHTMVPLVISFTQRAWWLKWFKNFLQAIQYAGMNDQRIISRSIKTNNIPSQFLHPGKTYLGRTWSNLHEVILAPAEFSKIKDNPDKIHLGFHPDYNRLENRTEAYLETKNSLLKLRGEGKKILYCSLGTVVKYSLQINKFLTILTDVVTKNDWVLVVSYQHAEKLKIVSNYQHLYFFNQLPQLDVLTNVDVFISHGGLNSISEAVHANVPLLIGVLEQKLDQPFNAKRCAELEIGVTFNLKKTTPSQLEEKIKTLLHSSTFKENMRILLKHNPDITPEQLLVTGNW